MQERIIQDLESVPFLPFRIVTTTGKSYEVTARNRVFFYVERRLRILVIGSWALETDPLFERDEIVSILHVVRLKPIA